MPKISKATVLLVEDDKIQAAATKDFLERTGYKVLYVRDGKSAIKMAKTQNIDIILLDLILPDIDGNEVARWLKTNDDTKGIPIIVLTVKGSTLEKVTGLEAGADDYLPKPYSEIELNARIYACLRTKALQDALRKKNQELEEVLLRVENLTITDSLTELFNRRYFESSIGKEFKRALRYNSPLSCLIVYADNFSEITENYGHDKANNILKTIARLLKSCVRGIDTIARWGEQEFIMMLPETPKEDTAQVAARILQIISNYEFPDFQEKITLSIGIAGLPDPLIETHEKLINEAELALYEAKTKGGNRIEFA